MYTVEQILNELSTWISFSNEMHTRARECNITTANNSGFQRFVSDWGDGMYDEDPDQAAQELEHIIKGGNY